MTREQSIPLFLGAGLLSGFAPPLIFYAPGIAFGLALAIIVAKQNQLQAVLIFAVSVPLWFGIALASISINAFMTLPVIGGLGAWVMAALIWLSGKGSFNGLRFLKIGLWGALLALPFMAHKFIDHEDGALAVVFVLGFMTWQTGMGWLFWDELTQTAERVGP
jgi:hypothetical protein